MGSLDVNVIREMAAGRVFRQVRAHRQPCWGRHPPECAAALDKIARGTGVHVKIAVVTGDDVMGHY